MMAMEPDAAEVIEDVGSPPEPKPVTTGGLRIAGVLALLVWAISILICLFSSMRFTFEIGIFLIYSLTAFTGFYLACGNARWWARWLLASLSILLIASSHYSHDMLEGISYHGVFIVISAGFTFAGRMILSAFRGESSARQRFTIFGLMVVTAITAVCLLAINYLFLSNGATDVAVAIAILTVLGFAMTAQCTPAWTNTKREAFVFAATGFLIAIPSSLIIYGILAFSENTTQLVEEVMYPVWMIFLLLWLILYPLWFSFYALGWKLIHPSWKLGPRHAMKSAVRMKEKEVDVLMED